MKTVTDRDGVKHQPALIRTTQFQAVCFFDQEQKRQVVLLYSLGVDGIIREYNGGANTWREYPVTK